MRRSLKIFLWIATIVFVLLIVTSKKSKNEPSITPPTPMRATSRPFYLGFTSFAPDITQQAVETAYAFMKRHGDIIAHHFDSGIPWTEAYENKDFSQDLQNNWSLKRTDSGGLPLYVAITPLDGSRSKLANYWGEKDNMPLPGDWRDYRLNDEHVKTAFLHYAERVVDYFHPKYLAIGIESNELMKDRSKWQDYLELNAYVYDALKRAYPSLTVFSTVQYEFMRGLISGGNRSDQLVGVKTLMQSSDILALSTYHFGAGNNPTNSSYWNDALSIGKPVAIAESGSMSDQIKISGVTWNGSLDDQKNFESFLLDSAAKDKFLFVINFVPIDYDKLMSYLSGSASELAKYWVHTGLEDTNLHAKPALSVWDSYLEISRT